MKKKTHKRRRISGVKKTTHRRRRSHSKVGAIDMQNLMGVIGGAVIAGYLNKLVPATVNDKVLAAGKVGIGLALPMISKDGKTKNLLAGIGSGMIAVGAVDLLKSFGALSGDFDIPVINGDVLSGDDDIPVINGDVLALDEESLNGDDDIPVINGDVLAEDEMGEDEMGEDFLGEDED